MDVEEELKSCRKAIDDIDKKLIELINERASYAKRIAQAKQHENQNASFYRPEREAEILRRIVASNKGPLSNEEISRLFREVMSACLALEKKLTIAFLGPPGTFTEEAALKHFGHSVNTRPLNTIEEVFREVEADGANYGVVPIENSIEGVVSHTLDQFLTSPLKINGEVELRVHQNLLCKESDSAKIRVIYSHPHSFGQCREWLDENMRGVERISVKSNAEAARLAAHENGAGAIASEIAAKKYKLEIMYKNIEDSPDNITRFLIIGRQSVPPSGSDKTSIIVSARNKPGALFSLLEPFAKHNVSMTRIESRPSHCVNWEYVFFLDLEGHELDTAARHCLDELRHKADMFKILGSYPKACL